MSSMTEAIAVIRDRWPTTVRAPTGEVRAAPPLAVPNDLEEFYDLYGGLDIDDGGGVEEPTLKILPPNQIARANPVILGDDGKESPSYNWFLLAFYNGNYVTIDFSVTKNGRCYDSYFDCHAMPGSCRVLASSFTDFLKRIAHSSFDHPRYWESDDGFDSLGDAFDPVEVK